MKAGGVVPAAIEPARAADAAADLRGYRPGQSLMAQARALARLAPAALEALDGAAVPAVLARDLGRALDIAPRHFFRDILDTNRSAAEKKSFTDAPLPAAAGQVALRLLWLLGRAEAAAGGGAGVATRFDAARWLGHWLEAPQAELDGHAPAALLAQLAVLERLGGLLQEQLKDMP